MMVWFGRIRNHENSVAVAQRVGKRKNVQICELFNV